MTNIYLDIDGVLLDGDQRAAGADEFIEYVTTRFPETIYWLSGRCSGDAERTVAQLRPFFGRTTLARLSLIKPTEWPLVKTQAIDFGEPFLWFDDVLEVEDEAVLTQHGVSTRSSLWISSRSPSNSAGSWLASPRPEPAAPSGHIYPDGRVPSIRFNGLV